MKGVHKKIILSSILILSLVAGLIWDNAFREIFFGTLCALILWRILSLIEMFRKIGKHQWFRYGKSRFDYKTLLLLLIFGEESFEIPHNDLAIDSLPDLKTKLSIRFQEKMTPTI
jgi:hypothetical protein